MTDSSDDELVCGSTDTHSGEPCQNPVDSEDARCWMHSDETDSSPGAPEGNDNAVGNDGGAPEGNLNGLKHGNSLSLSRRMDYLREHAPDSEVELFREYYKEYAAKAENRSAAAQLAIAEVFQQRIERELLDADLWVEVPVTTDDGQVIYRNIATDEFVVDPEYPGNQIACPACEEDTYAEWGDASTDVDEWDGMQTWVCQRCGSPIDPSHITEQVTKKRLKVEDIGAYTDFMREIRLLKKYEGVTDSSQSGVGVGDPSALWEGETAAGTPDV